MMSTTTLDPMSFPLFGKRLIEASAGTGKTYTIANLYLRLLLPLTSADDFHRPLTVDQILVVTFTEAATAELKARIHSRIRQARKALLRVGNLADSEETLADNKEARRLLAQDDPFLSQLIASMSAEQIALGVEHLLYAEKQMDEAAIFTIHGFCQRMLSQNAFESRMLFQQTLETDEQVPLAMAVKDVWRANIYPMTSTIAALVKAIWSNPAALQKELRVLQSQPDILIEGTFDSTDDGTDEGTSDSSDEDVIDDSLKNSGREANASVDSFSFLEQKISAAEKHIIAIKSIWLADAHSILAAMNESGLDGRFWVVKKQEQVAHTILQWAQSDDFSLPKELKKFSADEQTLKLKKNGQRPNHAFFDKVATLFTTYPTAEKIQPVLLESLWRQVQDRLQKWKQQTQKFTFTDLLTSLDHALSLTSEYPLAERIQQLYPFAMIDEFQDTDPVQYRIFNQIYQDASSGNKADNQQLGLVMIGDPKQAIYAFRGADIYTYLAAKEQVDAMYSLGTNYRSSAAMIQSVNGLFSGQDNPFKVSGIPFVSVQDRHTEGVFYRQGKQQAALQLLLDDDVFADDAVLTPAQYQIQMADQAGEHIAQLLSDAAEGVAMLAQEPVQSGDIAILVSGYRQAQLMKAALGKRGVASVYLSDRGSVFASNEARDLLLVLNAILNQGKEIPVRSALATHLLGWNIAALDELNQNDILYDDWVGKFRNYYVLWDEYGVLPMLRALIRDLNIGQQLLANTQGERRLTDLLHLGEKLQQKAAELESKEGLVRYLTLAIQQPNGDSDEQKIRLETDDDLVRIITVHKSKGLEYPIVYLPFACTPFRNKDKHALYHDGKQKLHYAPTPEEEQKRQHEAELYASEIRLAYVALTRAREVCYIGCAQVGKAATKSKGAELSLHLSGVGALLSRGKKLELGEFELSINQWLAEYSAPLMACAYFDNNQSASKVNALQAQQKTSYAAKTFTGHIERDWWVGSYSSLVVNAGHAEAIEARDKQVETSEPGLDEFTTVAGSDLSVAMSDKGMTGAAMSDVLNDAPSPFTFPKGAKPGTFLHDLLEGKALNGVLENTTFADLLKVQYQTNMAEYITRQGYEKWQSVLFAWLDDILSARLFDEICLRDLTAQQCCKEMEFFLPVVGFNARQLDQIARQHDDLSAKAPLIQEQSLKGMLKGFIDLLFEHKGKYYVLDYKSNHLGMSLQDYHMNNMSTAMAEHRYDLQYQLYTLALHRFLSQRIADYDYDKHVGGVCYLFLRGLSAIEKSAVQKSESQNEDQKTGVFKTRLSKEHVLALDDLLKGKAIQVDMIKADVKGDTTQYDLF